MLVLSNVRSVATQCFLAEADTKNGELGHRKAPHQWGEGGVKAEGAEVLRARGERRWDTWYFAWGSRIRYHIQMSSGLIRESPGGRVANHADCDCSLCLQTQLLPDIASKVPRHLGMSAKTVVKPGVPLEEEDKSP